MTAQTAQTAIDAKRAKLADKLRTATKKLDGVTEKKWFGCEAFVVNENIFAFVWKTGRLGIKLLDEAREAALLSQKGAERWKAGEKVMSHWIFVPPQLESDPKSLLPWLKEAHTFASAAAPPKKKTSAAKPTAKKKTKKSTAKPKKKTAKRKTK